MDREIAYPHGPGLGLNLTTCVYTSINICIYTRMCFLAHKVVGACSHLELIQDRKQIEKRRSAQKEKHRNLMAALWCGCELEKDRVRHRARQESQRHAPEDVPELVSARAGGLNSISSLSVSLFTTLQLIVVPCG